MRKITVQGSFPVRPEPDTCQVFDAWSAAVEADLPASIKRFGPGGRSRRS
jgi:hypothetical protein